MTRPNWRPNQVRDQYDTVAQNARLLQTLRSSPATPTVGPGASLPTFAVASFHWPTSAGAITAGMSDSRTVRQVCSVVAATIDVTTYSTAFTIQVYVNGVSILSCPVGGAGVGQRFLCNPVALVPYSSTISVNATSPGTGNQGVFVSVECA